MTLLDLLVSPAYAQATTPAPGGFGGMSFLLPILFIGVMYLRGKDFKGVNATGILGIDEFRYNIPPAKR